MDGAGRRLLSETAEVQATDGEEAEGWSSRANEQGRDGGRLTSPTKEGRVEGELDALDPLASPAGGSHLHTKPHLAVKEDVKGVAKRMQRDRTRNDTYYRNGGLGHALRPSVVASASCMAGTADLSAADPWPRATARQLCNGPAASAVPSRASRGVLVEVAGGLSQASCRARGALIDELAASEENDQ